MSKLFVYLKRNKKWIWFLFAIATINTALNIGIIVSERIAHQKELDWVFYSINEFTGSYLIVLFVPVLFFIFRKWPLGRPVKLSKMLFYLGVSMLFGMLLTTSMYTIRLPLYKLAGITRIDEIFNNLPYRYLMEYFKQFLIFWLIYIVYWGIEQYNANRERLKRETDLREELLKSQLQSLQMQLHPHFFFNTLNTISSVMYTDPARADKLISRLSGFLRNVIDLKEQPIHSLEKEIDLLRQFTDVMLERYRDKLEVIYEIPDDCLSAEIPVLLLQPLAENAILYAIDFHPQTLVVIGAKHVGDYVEISIRDNGPGIAEGPTSQGTGLTTSFLRLQKLYGDDHKMELQNRDSGGLEVRISIPKEISI